VHWNAHPILHVPLPTVKGVLVQFPCVCGVGPRSTCATPAVVVVTGAVDVGDVEFDAAGARVVALDAGVVVVGEPDSGGSVALLFVEGCGVVEVPPTDQVMSMPSNRQTNPKTSSCHVCHERRSLMPNSPGAGRPVSSPGGGSAEVCSPPATPNGEAEGATGGASTTSEALATSPRLVKPAVGLSSTTDVGSTETSAFTVVVTEPSRDVHRTHRARSVLMRAG
jgi:hypothetical protein